MPARKVVLTLVALAVAAGFGWAALGGARPPERVETKLPYRRGGVSVSRVPAGGLSDGRSAEGQRNDLLLQNGRISWVLGAVIGAQERKRRYGALLDLALKDFGADELLELRPVLRIAGKGLRLAFSEVKVATEGKYPYLSLVQTSRDGLLRMTTDYRSGPGSSRIEIVTSVNNATTAWLRSVELGERTRWPGAPTFAPRIGFPKFASKAEVSWLARQGAKLSYALAFPRGPVQAQFFFDRIGPVGQETLFHAGDLPPGAEVVHRRELIVVEGDLGRVAEAAFLALRRKVGRIQGRLAPVPAWATVEALYPDGKTALSVRVDVQGRYSLPLPEGDYRVILRAPGGEDAAEVSVHAQQPPVDPELVAPMPGRLHYSITDADGAASPARVILRGVAPTPDPEPSPFDPVSGAKNVVFTRSGRGEVELPSGRYRVVVTRGPEYEIFDQEIELDAQTGAAIRAELQRSVDTSGWIGCDFHLHAAPSRDSIVPLEQRILSLLAEGVELAVATDHNHVTDYAPVIADLGAEQQLLGVSGIEITTPTWGHFNAFPYPLQAELPPVSGVTPAEVFAAVRARAPEAVIQVNHPRMPGVGYFNRIELNAETGRADAEEASLEFDAVEVVNGYDLESPALIASNLREYFVLLNSGRRYTATGNSDSHRMTINWVGYPRTYVRVGDDRPDQVSANQLARALLAGRAQVSNGIFLAVAVNGTAGPGDTVSGSRVTIQVEAKSPRWIEVKTLELWLNGALITASKLPRRTRGKTQSFRTELDLKEDAWLVFVARGEQPMNSVFIGRRVLPFAFTNPVYIDADQDGSVTPLHPAPPSPVNP